MASTTKHIPEGFHAVTPYLVVRNANEAIEFYKRAFGAVERFRMAAPDRKSVLHAEIAIGDSIIFLSDECPEMEAKSPLALHGTPVSIYLYVDDVDAVFNQAVAAGGRATRPLENMFWGDRYGEIVDPYGHRWSIASHVEDVMPEELARRSAEVFGKQTMSA